MRKQQYWFPNGDKMSQMNAPIWKTRYTPIHGMMSLNTTKGKTMGVIHRVI